MSSNKRRVHFNEAALVQESECLEDYTEEEILNYFYTSNELAKMVVRSLKEAIEATGYHRGLEKFTNQGEETATTDIERHLSAVMDEQDLQWENEQDDYDRLAAVSEETSRSSVALALKRAEEDEQEADRIYLESVSSSYTTPLVTRRKMTSPVAPTRTTRCISSLTTSNMLSGSRLVTL